MGTIERLQVRRARSRGATVGLIAHTAKQDEMLRLIRATGCAPRLQLIATEQTAHGIAQEAGEMEIIGREDAGGEIRLAAHVIDGNVDAVVFLRDPSANTDEPSIEPIMKACDVHGVPLATNRATAEILLRHLMRAERTAPSWISHPSVFSERRFPWDSPFGRIPSPDTRG